MQIVFVNLNKFDSIKVPLSGIIRSQSSQGGCTARLERRVVSLDQVSGELLSTLRQFGNVICCH